MTLYILFGQRKCSYPEQYAPEALEIMDSNAYSDNNEWLNHKLKDYEASNEFDVLRIIRVIVSGEDIATKLTESPRVEGEVAP